MTQQVFISDTNIWIDLRHAGLLDALFDLPFTLCCTDFVVAELQDFDVAALVHRGLEVHALDQQATTRLFGLMAAHNNSSLADVSCYLLAQETGYPLLTGDGRLRRQALHDGLKVHGALWLLDQLVAQGVTKPGLAATGLRNMLMAGAWVAPRRMPSASASLERLSILLRATAKSNIEWSCPMSLLAVIDFETTGLSPGNGDRATEVAIVLVEGGRVVDRFQSLMNAGVRIPAFITELTGITNAMVTGAPAAAKVMVEASRFVGHAPLVAHNAAFDSRFWQAELARCDLAAPQPFICTLLLSRRLYPEAPDHKLGSLIDYHGLARTGQAHRALADAEMAAALLARIEHDLRTRHGVASPDHGFLMDLQRCAKSAVGTLMAKYACA